MMAPYCGIQEIRETKGKQEEGFNFKVLGVLDLTMSKMAEHWTKVKFLFLYIWSRVWAFGMERMREQKETKVSLSRCDSFVSWWPCSGIERCYGNRKL